MFSPSTLTLNPAASPLLRPTGRVAEVTAHILLSRSSRQFPRSIIENSAITLGRVAWICPDEIAPHLGYFCTSWCQALREIRDDIEKEHAFLGLCR